MTGFLSSADLALARRMEAAEAANAFRLIRGAKAVKPDCGYEAEEILGGCAMFGGVGSPMTHLLGGGMSGSVTGAEVDRLEEFFQRRGSPSLIDLCPLADLSVVEQVMKRGYMLVEFNNLLARPIAGDAFDAAPGIEVRRVEPAESIEFTRLVSRGFSLTDEADEVLVEALATMTLVGQSFVACVDGQWAGGGTLGIENGVALLSGDSTRAPWRGRGVQAALIQARLRRAQEQGADLAMVTVLPGTSSHRNYERAGLRLVYMRVNVSREWE